MLRNWHLSKGDIHIWSFRRQPGAIASRQLKTWLSSDELERANRFVTQELQEGFMCSRAYLRAVLSKYLFVHPADVVFKLGLYGKPSIANEERLRFSFSHSGGMNLLAVSAHADLGVDVEKIRTVPNINEIALRVCQTDEAMALNSLADDQKQEAFFRLWTAKEAFVKATGQGLSRSFQSFSVPSFHFQNGCTAIIDEAGESSSGWRVHWLNTSGCYAAALAENLSDRPTISAFDWHIDDFQYADLDPHEQFLERAAVV